MMIKYNQGMPMYWRDEMSGKMLSAVVAFWSPYADSPQNIPELSAEHVCLLREYIVHWVEAPCFQANPHMTMENKLQLESAIIQAKNINNRADINVVLNALSELAIDPF